ncbi:hypothetical protein [Sphingobium chungbukense]|uniref:hypothetical protein n=1 Tax=Sphingobium chungbukense TaxID=56193 RepID=UPI00069AB870|nr:hypothetical protein [Sphingobium chungbukense]
MFQPDLFATEATSEPASVSEQPVLDVPGILERLADFCERPRYSFMVLNLIAQLSAKTGSAGPFVRAGETRIPVRDWLSDALTPVAQRDPRRLAIAEKVRRALEDDNALPEDSAAAGALIDDLVRERIRISGRTNVSRAVSELVRAGLVQRRYQGYRVDHHNRGAQRQVMYAITEEARRALRSGV